jgi:hypothetical protein
MSKHSSEFSIGMRKRGTRWAWLGCLVPFRSGWVGALCRVAGGTRLARRLWPAVAAADREAGSVMTEAAVEVIQAADRMRGLACLTLAFATDPVMRWGWPDPYRYLAYWPQIADTFGGRAFDTGTAHGLEDRLAVAL